MKIFILLIMLVFSAMARDIAPEKEIVMQGNVLDIVIAGDTLYAGTDAGTLEMYDIKKDTMLGKVSLENIHDFTGELMAPKVYAVDVRGAKKLLLSEGENGSRELFIHEKNVTTKVITPHEKLTMNKARFVDDTHVFLGLLSNEIILYDLSTKKQLYRVQLSESKFSDFALSEDRTKAALTCESGIVYIVEVQSGKVVKTLKTANKDNVFKLDFKNGIITTAGQDRKAGVYTLASESVFTFDADFLIYATGLSADAKLGGFAFNDDNMIRIFDLTTKTKLFDLKGQKSTLNSIVFYDNHTVFSGSDDKIIMKWSLK